MCSTHWMKLHADRTIVICIQSRRHRRPPPQLKKPPLVLPVLKNQRLVGIRFKVLHHISGPHFIYLH
jgi:hypothetical protein